MANLYSVLPGLTPSSQEIIEAELLAKQLLEGKYPDLDLREGTGLRDLVLRPTAYAFALLKKATDFYFSQNTIASVDNTTPEEVVDDLLSNWFITRNTGTKAVISTRLFFARAKNVTLSTEVGFSPDNKLYFFPEVSQAYPSTSMQYDAYSNEWYLDVTMIAASTGSDYNLSSGSLLYFVNFDPYFLRAEINYLITESSPAETNSEFISRAGSAISTRNLVNIPSIDSNIRQTFNYIDRVLTVGAGDPDMIRDMIVVYPPPPTYYRATGASTSGSLVTLQLIDHNFQPGQLVEISEALPSVYNSTFSIVAIDSSNIVIEVPNNPGYVSALPKVSLATEPVYIHDAGAVDVYCCSRLSSSISQLTTNDKGVATVYGPVIELSRSSVSGGDLDDTIPVTIPVTFSSYSVNRDTKSLSVSLTSNTVSNNSQVFISGLEQYEVASSISCTGLTVSAKLYYGHDIKAGDTIQVSGVTPASYNGEFIVSYVSATEVFYTTKTQISGPGSGVIRIKNVQAFDKPSVDRVDGNIAVVSLPYLWGSSLSVVSGTLEMTQYVDYSVSNPYCRSPQLVNVYISNGTAHVLCFNHGISVGRRVLIEGYRLPDLDGYWKVDEVISGSEFTVDVSSIALPDSPTSSAYITYVENSKDFGFSMEQRLDIDFGSAYANKTASFELMYFRDASNIQDYLSSPDKRVVCGNYLARGFNITLLDIDIVSYGTSAFDTSAIQNATESYLSSLSPGSTFVLSDLVSSLYKNSITNIRTPVGVKYSRYTRDLTTPESGVIIDYLDPLDRTNIFLLRNVTSTNATT